jgi:hypothetical protein
MKTLPFAFGLVALLTACSPPPQRFAVPAVPVTEEVSIAYASVEVRDVLLPTYASLEEIFVETADGSLTSSPQLLWADDPTRAATLELTRSLSAITGARVASEPWPFDSYAEVRVEVRVEEFIASERGEFRLSGQYFVATFDGEGRDRAVPFRLTVPLIPEAGPAQIAAARAAVMAELAASIARDGLR